MWRGAVSPADAALKEPRCSASCITLGEMTDGVNRVSSIALAAACAAVLTLTTARGAAAPPACDSDNGGLKLPQGFCALVVADDLGAARHMTVAPNGDLYVSLRDGRGQTPCPT